MEESNKNNKEAAGKNMAVTRNRIARVVILLILVVAALSGRQIWPGGTGGNNSNTDSQYYESSNNNEESSNNNSYKFRNDKYLLQHFEKHGGEFGYATKEEYLAGANKVISSKDALHKTEAEDGDDVYYLEQSNEFVIVSVDGYIRTYFKPSGGIDYYNRQ
ncbi:MAG: hypothetical protein K1W06_11680 [Lachnospiraceae bacterium]